MKVKEVEIAKEVIRSDGWWCFACGDVLLIGSSISSLQVCESRGSSHFLPLCFQLFPLHFLSFLLIGSSISSEQPCESTGESNWESRAASAGVKRNSSPSPHHLNIIGGIARVKRKLSVFPESFWITVCSRREKTLQSDQKIFIYL